MEVFVRFLKISRLFLALLISVSFSNTFATQANAKAKKTNSKASAEAIQKFFKEPKNAMALSANHVGLYKNIGAYLNGIHEWGLLNLESKKSIESFLKKQKVSLTTPLKAPKISGNELKWSKYSLVVNKDGSYKTSTGQILRFTKSTSADQVFKKIFLAYTKPSYGWINLFVNEAYAAEATDEALAAINEAMAVATVGMGDVLLDGTSFILLQLSSLSCGAIMLPGSYIIYNIDKLLNDNEISCLKELYIQSHFDKFSKEFDYIKNIQFDSNIDGQAAKLEVCVKGSENAVKYSQKKEIMREEVLKAAGLEGKACNDENIEILEKYIKAEALKAKKEVIQQISSGIISAAEAAKKESQSQSR